MKKTPQQITELKHYIRASMKTHEREIIVEKLTVDSASFKFLKRMEESRKQQECVRTIDMRGKVPYECKSYVHKNQVFWMDDISYEIYLRGMKENNDVFTNKVFESIIQGEHTNHKQKKNINTPVASTINDSEEVTPIGFNPEKFIIEGNKAEVSYLGYYQKRQEIRFKHATEILISINGQSFPAKTKDISSHGLKFFFQTPVKIDINDEFLVTFTGFNNTSAKQLLNIKYSVLDIQYKEPDFILCAVHCNPSTEACEFIQTFIEEQQQNIKGRKKIDFIDIELTSASMLTELYYTNATPSVPFFINDNKGKYELTVVCVNAINRSILQCFKNDNDIYEFTNLSEHSRITKLVKNTQDDGQKDPILAVYTDNQGKPKVLFDYDFPESAQWYAFVKNKLKSKNITLFKVIVRTVVNPDERKIALKIDKLKAKSQAKDVVDDLVKFSDKIVKSGVLVDVTAEMRSSVNTLEIDKNRLNEVTDLIVSSSALHGNDTEILQFGYKEQRREDRYHVSVDAEVLIGDKKYKGSTKDLSIKGLSIELDTSDAVGYKKGDVVEISFPVLHKRASERINLINIPYTITCAHMENAKPVLHLRREKTSSWNDQSAFFKDLIGRNIELIKLDTKDIETSAKSKLMGSIAVENTTTLPLFIHRGKDAGSNKIVSIAMPSEPSPFVDFFEVEPGVYNFKAITHANRISKLLNKAKNKNISDLIIYLYKVQISGIAKYELYSAISSDFESDKEKQDFLLACQDYDYRIIKLSISNVQEPDSTEISAATEPLQEIAPHYAQRQSKQFSSIIAVGDVIDVSNQVMLPVSLEG